MIFLLVMDIVSLHCDCVNFSPYSSCFFSLLLVEGLKYAPLAWCGVLASCSCAFSCLTQIMSIYVICVVELQLSLSHSPLSTLPTKNDVMSFCAPTAYMHFNQWSVGSWNK